jgi:hypothetical protein
MNITSSDVIFILVEAFHFAVDNDTGIELVRIFQAFLLRVACLKREAIEYGLVCDG